MEIRVIQRRRAVRTLCPRLLAFGLAVGSAHLGAQGNPDALALSLEQQGKSAEAVEAWKASARAHRGDPVPYAHMGLLEARQEHYAQSIAYYRKAMALDPSMPGLQLNLGLALFKAGDYKQAIDIFTPMLKSQAASSPQAQRLNILLGMSYYGLGEFPPSIPYLKQAAETDANNLPLLLTLAHSCLISSQYQCVLDAYHRMVALNANSAEADILVGEALDEMKDTDGALREFRAAIQANSKEPNAHFGLGYLLWVDGHSQEAADEFQAELNNEPGHTLAMLYLADAEIQLNKFAAARPLLETVVKDNPSNAMGHLDLGIVDAEADLRPEAAAEFKRAIALKPTDPKPHYHLARLLRSMGKTAEANAEFAKTKMLNDSADEGLVKVMSKVPDRSKAPSTAATTP